MATNTNDLFELGGGSISRKVDSKLIGYQVGLSDRDFMTQYENSGINYNFNFCYHQFFLRSTNKRLCVYDALKENLKKVDRKAIAKHMVEAKP